MNPHDIDPNGNIALTITASDATLTTLVSSAPLISGSRYFSTLLSPSSPFSESLNFHSHNPLTGPFPLSLHVSDLGLLMIPILEILRILHCPQLTENVTSYPKSVRRLLPLAEVVDYLDCKEGVGGWTGIFLNPREMAAWEMKSVRGEVDGLLFCGVVLGSGELVKGVVKWCVMNGAWSAEEDREGKRRLMIPRLGRNGEDERCGSCGADLGGEEVAFTRTPERVVRAVGEMHEAAVRVIAEGLGVMARDMQCVIEGEGAPGDGSCKKGKENCSTFAAGVALSLLAQMGVLEGVKAGKKGDRFEPSTGEILEKWKGRSVRELMKMLEKMQKESEVLFSVACKEEDKNCEPFGARIKRIKEDLEALIQTLKVEDFTR